jgi:hypothetical protein
MSNAYRFPRRRPPRRPFKRRFRRRVASRNLTIAALLIVALVLAAPSILQVWHGQRDRAVAGDRRSQQVLGELFTRVSDIDRAFPFMRFKSARIYDE